jgi:hypothetical protein
MNPNTLLGLVVVVFWLGLVIAVKASKSTTSLIPIIPFLPGALWMAGIITNRFASPWGTRIIVGIHIFLLLLTIYFLIKWRCEKNK